MKKVLDEVFQEIGRRHPETPFTVQFWDGAETHYGSGPEKFRIVFRRERSMKNILAGGSLVFGEEYTAGNILIEGDMQRLLAMYDDWRDLAGAVSLPVRFKILFNRAISRGTRSNSRKNIHYHYDIGNDFYSLWLDPTMTYSCAYFKNGDDRLETAQINKYDHICRKLQLKPGQTLVDIGCGWGGMMVHAAKFYGAKCVGYTLSENQYDYLRSKLEKDGLAGSVEVRFEDYRKASGLFDKFVSIGMFEHVGKVYYPEFFATVKRILKPGGTGLLHTIGSRFGAATDPWISKYIFPGGFVPTLAMICENMNLAGLVFFDIEDLRMHYAKTLDLWAGNFEMNAAKIHKIISRYRRDVQAADDFMRMWRLYLNASAVSFKDAGNRLYQVLFSNGPDNGLPLTRDYIYSEENHA